MRIAVHIGNIPHGRKVAATGNIDGARRIILHNPLAHFHRPMLSPGFVEGHPRNDRRIIIEMVDHPLEFGHPLFVLGIRPLGIDRIARLGRPVFFVSRGIEAIPIRVRTSGNLILPDQHPETVAVIIVKPRFDLDMLADHVKSGLFEEINLEEHGVLGRRRQQPVRPPALIQRPPVEDGFAIERETPVAVLILDLADLANARIGFHAVELLSAFVLHENLQLIKRRGSRRP